MKKSTTLQYIISLLILIIFNSCDKDEIINEPPTITLESPVDQFKVQPGITSVLLEWKGQDDADTNNLLYDLYFGNTVQATPFKTNLAESSFLLENLELGKAYQWKVIVTDGVHKTSSEIRNFSTGNLPTISLTAPAKDVTLTEFESAFELTWNAQYDDGDLVYDVYFGETLPETPTATNITQPVYEVSGLSPNATYQWKVVARSGVAEKASETWSFNTAGTTERIIDWAPIDNAVSYNIYMSETPSNYQLIGEEISDTSYTFTNLENDKKYYFRLNIIDNNGNLSGRGTTFDITFKENERTRLYVGDLMIKTQEEADVIAEKKYTEIIGGIQVSEGANLTHLNAFSNLKFLRGINSQANIKIEKNSLLTGPISFPLLENGRLISIKDNPKITSINFPELKELSELELLGNNQVEEIIMSKLTNLLAISIGKLPNTSIRNDDFIVDAYEANAQELYGHEKLSKIDLPLTGNIEQVRLSHLPALSNLDFLENVTQIIALQVSTCDKLEEISLQARIGFSTFFFNQNLLKTELKHWLSARWYGNPNLKSLEGEMVDNLLPGALIISNNDKLENLDGLSFLQKKADIFWIFSNNPSLDDFCGIKDSFDTASSGRLIIKENKYNPTPEEILNGNCSE